MFSSLEELFGFEQQVYEIQERCGILLKAAKKEIKEYKISDEDKSKLVNDCENYYNTTINSAVYHKSENGYVTKLINNFEKKINSILKK